MLKNFITVAVRNFLRQRLYSIINLLGLTSGLICTVFIFLWVNDEVTKDHFHQDGDRIFRIVTNIAQPDGSVITWPITPGPLADYLKENIPEVELAARTMSNGDQLFQRADKHFLEKGLFADPEFLQLFSFKIIEGNAPPINQEKNWVAISRQLAMKLFDHENPIGQVVRVSKKYDLTVTSVFEDIGDESSIHFNFLLPMEIYREQRGDGFNWGNFDHPLYLKLSDADKAHDVLEKMNSNLSDKINYEGKHDTQFYIQPFTDAYLYSGFELGLPITGRIQYVKIFSVVAIFILAIACINFMNMSTARAVTRAKEVGVRKVVGAQRRTLILQFIAESLLLSTVAMVLALTAVYLLMPLFNHLMSKSIELELTNPNLIIGLATITVVTGVLAGSYPAFFLSAYQPVNILKGTNLGQLTGNSLRSALVVFQFSLTLILIVSALIIYNQVSFIRNKNLGYKRDNILTFTARGGLRSQFDAFREEASQLPGVVSISRSNQSLVEVSNQSSSVNWPGKPEDAHLYFRAVVIDFNFLETMGLELKDGRFFSPDYNDSSNFILSENAVDIMGLTDPIGQKISLWGNEGTVVGVIGNFHSRSLHEAMDPIVFYCRPHRTSQVVVKIKSDETESTLVQLEALSRRYNPEYPFEYSFLDDDFERLYAEEKTAGSLAVTFTSLAVLISCLGLVGLAAYTAERRRKEISIRKTLGASATRLVAMMSGNFLRLMFISVLIGSPIAYYLMDLFLGEYAYHTELNMLPFVAAAGLVTSVAMITVLYQISTAARANPVDALRKD